MEKISVKRVGKSKWGFFLQDELESFTGVTEQVHNFLKSQIPCEIEVEASEGEGKYRKITRVKVLGKSNNSSEFEEPIEVVRPGEDKLMTADKSNGYWDDRQDSIESQMAIKSAIEMIKSNNDCDEFENIKPTMENVRSTALIVKQILKDIKGK